MSNCHQHCCGANAFFDLKGAKKEANRFRKSGPRKSTKHFIAALHFEKSKATSLLDIGGGIGAIPQAFLSSAPNRSVSCVDASSGYLKVAKELSKEYGNCDNIDFRQANFVDIYEEIENHDIVTLDKVVCCYPDYKALLTASLSKCRYQVALSFPMGGPIGKCVTWLGGVYLNFFSAHHFRPYMHSPKDMNDFVLSQGFEQVSKSTSFPWHIWVFQRKETH